MYVAIEDQHEIWSTVGKLVISNRQYETLTTEQKSAYILFKESTPRDNWYNHLTKSDNVDNLIISDNVRLATDLKLEEAGFGNFKSKGLFTQTKRTSYSQKRVKEEVLVQKPREEQPGLDPIHWNFNSIIDDPIFEDVPEFDDPIDEDETNEGDFAIIGSNTARYLDRIEKKINETLVLGMTLKDVSKEMYGNTASHLSTGAEISDQLAPSAVSTNLNNVQSSFYQATFEAASYLNPIDSDNYLHQGKGITYEDYKKNKLLKESPLQYAADPCSPFPTQTVVSEEKVPNEDTKPLPF